MGKNKREGQEVDYILKFYDSKYLTARRRYREYIRKGFADGQRPELGRGHGYASKNRNSAEIIFAIPKTETILQLCFNPYTVESPKTWAKLVKVEVSIQSPEIRMSPNHGMHLIQKVLRILVQVMHRLANMT